jgi:hypothetical protein
MALLFAEWEELSAKKSKRRKGLVFFCRWTSRMGFERQDNEADLWEISV